MKFSHLSLDTIYTVCQRGLTIWISLNSGHPLQVQNNQRFIHIYNNLQHKNDISRSIFFRIVSEYKEIVSYGSRGNTAFDIL